MISDEAWGPDGDLPIRRPHWNDELIEAVGTAIENADPACYPTVGMVSDIIAAVEDWHKAKRDSRVRTHSEGCWRWHNECAESLIEWQQAAIKRVRDLHCLTVDVLDGPEGPEDVDHCQECGYISIDAEPCPTIRAIEGDL